MKKEEVEALFAEIDQELEEMRLIGTGVTETLLKQAAEIDQLNKKVALIEEKIRAKAGVKWKKKL
jgi:pseudouridine-5'-phosphate glycosidase